MKKQLKRGLRTAFEAGQRLGVDVLPRHFYSEVPDIRVLRRESAWRSPYGMLGVQGVALEEQVAFVEETASRARPYLDRALNAHAWASAENGEPGYGPVEAAFLHQFVAAWRPAHIVQVGCGVSTAVCLGAAERAGYTPRVTCIEPYPTRFLTEAQAAGRISLVKEKVQNVPLSFWDGLDGEGLFFFVDSTHTLGPAGEVSRIILEVLPRLEVGARVHFHDITFPYDYPRDLLDGGLFFQHESVLLHAFLAGNARFRIEASLSMLHYERPDVLKGALPLYEPAPDQDGLQVGPGHFPSATYLKVIA